MKCRGFILGAVVAMALAGASCSESPVAQNSPAASPSTAAKPAAANPESSDSQDILSVLSVEHEVDLRAQREGTVMQIVRDEGSRVRSGEILAQMDDRSLAAELEKAKADLHVAEQNVKYNEAEVRAKEAAYRRQQELRKLGLSSDAELENSEFQAKGAEYDLQSWHAVVDRNKAAVRMTELEFEKTRIRTPFEGVVARRYIRQGQDVMKDEKCFRVSQLSPLRVQFQVSESSGRKPQPGDEVKVALVSDSRQVYSARISRVSPMVDPASGSYDLTAQLVGPDLSALRPGMAVRVLWPPATSPKP
jgi:membrane fusion protein (multidrug efflux system)